MKENYFSREKNTFNPEKNVFLARIVSISKGKYLF